MFEFIVGNLLDNDSKQIWWRVQSGYCSVEAQGISLTPQLCMDLLKRVPGAAITAISDKVCSDGCSRKLSSYERHISIEKDVSDTEIRRRIMTLLAYQAIKKNSMFLHASVIVRNQQAIVLLGNYGAGKTTVAMRMAQQGWQQVAGDICLISEEGDVIAGSRVVLSRKPSYKGMLPTRLPLPEGEIRWEMDPCHGGPYEGIKMKGVIVLSIHETTPYFQRLSQTELSQLTYQAATRVICRKNSKWGRQLLTEETKRELECIAENFSSRYSSIELKGDPEFIVEYIKSNF